MPVNTAALKTFAPAMRRQLIEAVGRKLDLLLHQASADTLTTVAGPIAELRQQEATNRQELLERVAYSWFNRLAAVRYLDARGWHPFGARVLMPQTESETQPELLKLLRSGSLPAELQPHTDEARLQGLLDGRLPTAMAGSDPQGEVYRELILAVCRSYNQLLPNLFEGLDDASELLLPDDLLSDGSIAGGFRSQICDSDCEDVEIIGWLYQFYISEKKDQVIGKVVKSEDIPAATQLFTPNWIVKYMVQNSLGAQWLATYPASALKGQMEYYIEPAEQTDEVKAQLAAITPEGLNPEELTLIDPACGSGHILVEAYNLLKAIYLERGYRQRDIPELILTKNLYGLDICPRAAQLAAFSLLMKGREDDRRMLERGIQLNVIALQDSKDLDVETLTRQIRVSDYELQLNDITELKCLFNHATTLGSLIHVPDGLAKKLPALKSLSNAATQDFFSPQAFNCLEQLVRQAELLDGRYNTVVANPPYMGSGGMNDLLKKFANASFPAAKNDLFACFIERSYLLAEKSGQASMVTMQNWMFLSSFQKMRENMLLEKTIKTMTQIGYNSFPSMNSKVAQATVFSLAQQRIADFIGAYINLNRAPQSADKSEVFLEGDPANRFDIAQSEFARIPGSPIAYWVSDRVREVFEASTSPLHRVRTIGRAVHSQGSLKTGNNPLFVRYTWEVSALHIGQDARWRHHPRGGSFRKWSGNVLEVVRWDTPAREHYRTDLIARIPEQKYWNIGGICWSEITTSITAFREYRPAEIANNKSLTIYPCRDSEKSALLGYLNTKVARYFLSFLNPTIGVGVGDVARLPWDTEWVNEIPRKAIERLVELGRDDWNSYEFASGFQSFPLLSPSPQNTPTLKARFSAWLTENKNRIDESRLLEEEINCLFIKAFGLERELTEIVSLNEITLTVNPAYRYGGNHSEQEQLRRFCSDTMTEFLSYATGCMMGRYSLDQPGLLLADFRDSQAAQLAAYESKVGKPLSEVQFKPDPDGIIPVLDGEWFEDDIVARTREFLAVTFPESSVAENLRFIEVSLGKDIRKYFCSEFYKDHLQTYKKRPIYWLVQSPKKGFSCLIYLHRYTKDTLNQVLNNYFRPYLQKLEARLAQLGLDQLNDDLPARERTAARKEAEKITKVLKECQTWEQDSLLPLAQQRIELDLDDGVKVNYLKLQDVLAPIPGLAAKED